MRMISGTPAGGRPIAADFAKSLHAAYARLRVSLPESRLGFLLVTIFSVLYFAETIVRASEKPFWFDELCTLYIVRLPSFADSWSAVLHGADYNPPLFYIIQRADRALFGEGLIALRLPAIIGFWTLCVCLFRFASKRAGPIAGWIAMVLPVLTGAYYYAYEARPHGIVLGFCGLALVCWQASEEEGPHRTAWLLAFATCLGAAFFNHCYALVIAIPFAIVETLHFLNSRQIRPLRWTALTVPAFAAAISFVPLLRSYRMNVAHTIFSSSFEAKSAQVARFYVYLVSPCFWILLLVLSLLAINAFGSKQALAAGIRPDDRNSLGDVTLAIGFLLVPYFGLAMARVTRGPFVPRYFMVTVAGLALVVTFVLSSSRYAWQCAAIALVLMVMLLLDARMAAWQLYKGYGEVLTEQSSGFLLGESGNPLAFYPLITSASKDLPIVVAEPLDFLYLVHYAPNRTTQLFHLTGTKDELSYRLYSALREWCHLGYNPVRTYSEFLPSHPDFLLYGRAGYAPLLEFLRDRGAKIETLRFGDRSSFIAKIHMQIPI